LTGSAEQLFAELGPANAWRGGTGDDWEKGPYYLRGLISLAFVLDDDKLKRQAKSWVDAILALQLADGQIGPVTNQDWWPRMLITWSLRDYFEATQDSRVIPALVRYARYMADTLERKPLYDWARARAADQIETMFWLYNHTGEIFLLEVADRLQHQANRWNEFFRTLEAPEGDFRSLHAVNVSQGLKFPAVVYQRTGQNEDRDTFNIGWRNLRGAHGLAFGMWSGTEHLAGHSDNQGVELCSIVEQLLSNATAIKVSADPLIADEQERIAYNLLASAVSREFKQHQYYTLPNSPIARRNTPGTLPFADDHGDDLLLSPHAGFHCCCFNLHMGWPKFVQHTWMATDDNGLAAVAHGPSRVKTIIKGVEVEVESRTEYPFADTLLFVVTAEKPIRFPLLLRVPHWSKAPLISVNGDQVIATAGSFARIDRLWTTGDVITMEVPAELSTVKNSNGAISVWRGPFVFSLAIDEQVELVTRDDGGFHEFELTSASAWNYALRLTKSDLNASLLRSTMPANPWIAESAPMRLQVKARKAIAWALSHEGCLAGETPSHPQTLAEVEEDVTLVPMGSQSLRITSFPWFAL
jgi:DUF1680 family protein